MKYCYIFNDIIILLKHLQYKSYQDWNVKMDKSIKEGISTCSLKEAMDRYIRF